MVAGSTNPFLLKDDRPTDKKISCIRKAVYPQYRFFIFSVLFISLTVGCNQRKELLTTEVYDGPIKEIDNIETSISDSLQIVVILRSPKLLQYENGDEHYPEGLYLEYYSDESLICTFKADNVIYTNEDGVYKGEGNVVVVNVEDGDELNTEELYWNPGEKIYYTDKFVTIESDGEIHTGEGLTANEDFSSYQIHQPAGTISIEEDL